MADDMADDDEHQYAERMFPEPVDLGIAEADRAVSLGHPRHPELPRGRGRRAGEQLVPRRRRGQGQGRAGHHHLPADPWPADPGRPFEPVKIGILIDMDLNQLLADWIDPTILAIEDALNEGVWGRSPVQLVIADARGLPRENYRKVIDGYRWLVEQGCVVVLGR